MPPEVFDSVAIRDRLDITNGKLKIVDALTANATANVTISNVAPAAVGTATISAWLEIDVAGTKYYIPCWT
jgi:hypothetical protein|tara:strand:- start:530 stop:742 length:213 start_codon:yes stop_codon:yes gene_type:complete